MSFFFSFNIESLCRESQSNKLRFPSDRTGIDGLLQPEASHMLKDLVSLQSIVTDVQESGAIV